MSFCFPLWKKSKKLSGSQGPRSPMLSPGRKKCCVWRPRHAASTLHPWIGALSPISERVRCQLQHGGQRINGHDEKEPKQNGGTDSIYFWPIFQAYVRDYPHKIWPEKWYSTSIFRILEFPLKGWEIIFWTHSLILRLGFEGKTGDFTRWNADNEVLQQEWG